MKHNSVIIPQSNDNFRPAIAELLRDNLVVRISGGYELTKHLPRLEDDIKFVTMILTRDNENLEATSRNCQLIEDNIKTEKKCYTKLKYPVPMLLNTIKLILQNI